MFAHGYEHFLRIGTLQGSEEWSMRDQCPRLRTTRCEIKAPDAQSGVWSDTLTEWSKS